MSTLACEVAVVLLAFANATAAPPPFRETWIVAIGGPMDRMAREEITQNGGRIVGFFPPHAYVVRALPAQADKMRQSHGVAAVARRLPQQKISSRIERSVEGRLLLVHVFEGERVAPVAEKARQLGAVVMEEWDSARVRRLLVRAGGETVNALAEIPEVEWIEDAPRPTLRNDVVR